MDEEVIKQRQQLSFAQAEGAVPLPSIMKRTEITQHLRVRLWQLMDSYIRHYASDSLSGGQVVNKYIRRSLLDYYVNTLHQFPDTFPYRVHEVAAWARPIFESGTYVEIFDMWQHLLRTPKCPALFAAGCKAALKDCGAAYRLVFDPPTFIPITSDEEVDAVTNAFAELKNTGRMGAAAHLSNAADALNKDNASDAIRESIHCVESVARSLAPGNPTTFKAALSALDEGNSLHSALKSGFEKFYGYTSDEKGIRHSLLNDETSRVGIDEALFMFSACAAFSSYLSRKYQRNAE